MLPRSPPQVQAGSVLPSQSDGWASICAPATGGGGICRRREREAVSLEVVSTAPVTVVIVIILVLIPRRIWCYPVHRDEWAELGAERRRRCEDSNQHDRAETS